MQAEQRIVIGAHPNGRHMTGNGLIEHAAHRRTVDVLAARKPRIGLAPWHEHARVDFLTPSLLRIEYSSTGQFVDAPTTVVKVRDWSRIAVRVSHENGWLVEKTSALAVC